MDTTIPNAKPTFTVRSFDALIGKINNKYPDKLKTDWREFLKSEFQLSAEQENSLEDIPPERVRELQDLFIKAAQQGGTIKAKIVKLAAEKQTKEIAHELHIRVQRPDHTLQASATVQPFIRIAHCDADCKHWGWG